MKKLIVLYPFLPVLYGEKGISSSEAQRKKEENKNKATFLLEELIPNNSRMYTKVRETLSESGFNSVNSEVENPHLPEHFNILPQVQELYYQSAIFGAGLNTAVFIREEIEKMTAEDLGKSFDIIFTQTSPNKKKAVKTDITAFCNFDRIEDLLRTSSLELVNELAPLFREGLILEAKAAVLGNQYTINNSLLRTISKAPQIIEGKTIELANMVIYEKQVLNINKDEFAEVEKSISKEYESLQNQRNYIVKQIKDAARALDLKYTQEYQKENQQYIADFKDFNTKIDILRTELLQEAAGLRILL